MSHSVHRGDWGPPIQGRSPSLHTGLKFASCITRPQPVCTEPHPLYMAPAPTPPPDSTGHQPPDIFKLVHYEARTVDKWAVSILLECFLVTKSSFDGHCLRKNQKNCNISILEVININYPAKIHSTDNNIKELTFAPSFSALTRKFGQTFSKVWITNSMAHRIYHTISIT